MSGPNAIPPISIKQVASDINQDATTILTFASGSFTLPFPVGLQIDSEYNWESKEMGFAGSEIGRAGGINMNLVKAEVGSRAVETFKETTIAGLLDFAAGEAGTAALKARKITLNPKREVLFNGVQHRAFQLEWHFTPLNENDSNLAATFIKEIHKAAAPSITESTTFLTYPDYVAVVIQDKENIVIDRQQCAITALSCNFTPDGLWASFTNGKPVHIMLTAGFIELQLPTKKNAESLFEGI